MRDYRRLKVWERAHAFALAIYQATRSFPKRELYGLTAQTRRAAVSVAANIAEGYGHASDKELARYLAISISSSSELSYHLLLAKDLAYLTEEKYLTLRDELDQVQRMLISLRMKADAGV